MDMISDFNKVPTKYLIDKCGYNKVFIFSFGIDLENDDAKN
jgi:hypothetical protein